MSKRFADFAVAPRGYLIRKRFNVCKRPSGRQNMFSFLTEV